MVDLSPSAPSVVSSTGQQFTGTAGEAITPGQTVYLASNNQYFLADSNFVDTANVRGVALNSASLDQPIRVIKDGEINPGDTVVIGTVYVLSDTLGGIKPVADLGSGEFVTVIGIGTTTSIIALGIQVGGVAVP